MKKFILGLLGLLTLSFYSCSTSDEESWVFTSPVDNQDGLIAYPMRNYSISRASSSDGTVGEWETWTKIKLAGVSDSVATPWNDISTSGKIPTDVRMDIKHKDGWNLIAHTINGKGERNMNYLFFHNRYSGILKVFYYANKVEQNTTGIWHLHFEQPQSFLAFSNTIAETTSVKSNDDIYLTNLSTITTKAFNQGWNCFQIELAYDPNFSEGTLQVIPETLTTSKINLDGSFEATTDGTIISTTTSNPLNGVIKGVAGLAGKSAEKWVENALKSDKFKKIKADVVKGAGSIVTSGAASLLGSFVGAFDKNNQTTQTVNLKTTGTTSLEGTITTMTSSNFMPITLSISIKNVGRLGAWCLTQTPIVYMEPYATYLGRDPYYPDWYQFRMQPYFDNNQTNCVTINPDLLAELGWNNISLGIDNYLRNTYIRNDLENSFSDRNANQKGTRELLYDDTYDADDVYYTVSLPLYDRNGLVMENLNEMMVPYEIFLPNAPGGHKGACPNISLQSSYKSVFGVRLKTRYGDTVQMYHTFIPRLEWNYERFYSDKSYLREYPTVQIGDDEE